MRILYLDCFLGFDANMLVGALVDCGANPELINTSFDQAGINASLSIKATTRSAIACKKACIHVQNSCNQETLYENEFVNRVFENCSPSDTTNPISVLAAMYALEQLGIDYIITSNISLDDNTDGNVLNILSEAGIEILPSDVEGKNMSLADAVFLTHIANESGPKPPMQIISIGYGAGGNDAEKPDIINTIIGEFNSDNLIEFSTENELIDML